jgi:membrane protease YdiL (CAAX protease family)
MYKKVLFAILVAFVLWTLMFSPWTSPCLNFWWAMAASALVLTSLVAFFARDTFLLIKFDLKNILLGVGIAAALWGVFWLGDFLSSLILPFARDQVNSIYAMKEGQSPWMLSALLLLLIGPAEEIFWRGFVQRKLSERWSATKGFLVTTLIYALVHLVSLNFMLIMSALVCGLIWGGLYRLIPHRFAAIVLSHALWDAAVFIWWPI